MTQLPFPESMQAPSVRYPAGLAVWVLGWVALVLLDGPLDVSGLGMLLVLITALGSVWLPLLVTLGLGVLAVTAFNWMFVPPRGSFAIDVTEDAVRLLVMFVLSAIVAGLMAMLRTRAEQARRQAQAADTLRAWSERLRDSDDVLVFLPELPGLLHVPGAAPAVLLVLRAGLPAKDDRDAAVLLGRADAEQSAGLWYCLRNGHRIGPVSGRYEQLADVYLPLRGRDMTYGAALVDATLTAQPDTLAHAQDLCDRVGAALERQHLQRQQALSREAAHEQELRATLLTAIAHEYRTPLATIMGTASMLERQDERLDHAERRHLALRIVDQAARLRQLTGNVLQLARLDAPGSHLRCDWESAEELVGGIVQRFDNDARCQRLRTNVQAGLPLLWCDSLLISQLLDNLVDNALKHGVPDAPVCIGARSEDRFVALYVQDGGPGIADEQRELIFQPFIQGKVLPGLAAPRGFGLGLALCRVIAAAHHGDLRLDSSSAGSCFSCRLPLREQPQLPVPAGDAAA
jgi:two-component system sensor histidine kinase KdpD